MNAVVELYRLLLRVNLTRGRSAAMLGLGLLSVPLAIIVRASDPTTRDLVDVIAEFGLSVILPVTTAWVATSLFGDLTDDRLLVYLWIKPVNRWVLAVAATAATVTVMVPLVVVPLVIAAIATGVGSLVPATILASLLAVVAYGAGFVALGLQFRRALWWALAYILIWENTVARIGDGTAQLSIRSYCRSVLADIVDVRLTLTGRGSVAAVLVPLLFAVAATAFVAWRLDHLEVD